MSEIKTSFDFNRTLTEAKLQVCLLLECFLAIKILTFLGLSHMSTLIEQNR